MDYRKLTRRLIARVRELQQEVADCIADCESSLDYAHKHHTRVEGRLRAERNELERETVRERNANSSRQFDRDDALRDLQRACQRGDDWGRRRAMNRLRDL